MDSTPFQHTAARRRLLCIARMYCYLRLFQHTAARRRLLFIFIMFYFLTFVSTHSRAEAAANYCDKKWKDENRFNTQPRGGGCPARSCLNKVELRFNTQPRGGGCLPLLISGFLFMRFQHTAARRRLHPMFPTLSSLNQVSTHSRAEAAAVELHLSTL